MTFAGKGPKYLEGMSKLVAYLRVTVGKRIHDWVSWARAQRQDITEDAVEPELGGSIQFKTVFVCTARGTHDVFGRPRLLDRWSSQRGKRV